MSNYVVDFTCALQKTDCYQVIVDEGEDHARSMEEVMGEFTLDVEPCTSATSLDAVFISVCFEEGDGRGVEIFDGTADSEQVAREMAAEAIRTHQRKRDADAAHELEAAAEVV